jgi:hypothetical protein
VASGILVGGVPEGDFRIEIETLLRVGRADDAADRLRALLEGLCGSGRPLPGRFLTVEPKHVRLAGWDELPKRIAEYDRRGKSITAIEIAFSSPRHHALTPDATGSLDPHIETSFYCDGGAWPFSTCDRDGLLACYAANRGKWLGHPKWRGQFEEIDDTVSVKGIADLYGAVFRLTADGTTLDDQQARVVGACYVAVLVYLAVRDIAPRSVLPRPMAMFVGSNQDYPFFNAPAFAAQPRKKEGLP